MKISWVLISLYILTSIVSVLVLGLIDIFWLNARKYHMYNNLFCYDMNLTQLSTEKVKIFFMLKYFGARSQKDLSIKIDYTGISTLFRFEEIL